MHSVTEKDNYNEAGELRGLFEKQLREMYWTEHITENLLKGIIVQSSSNDLVKILEKHLEDTAGHISRLQRIFDLIGVKAAQQPYKPLECLVDETEDFIKTSRQGVVRDAGIIGLLQKFKHYEIACYGTMRAYALALREEEVVLLLEQTLQDEKGADLLLTGIAESHINTEAADKEV